MIGNISGSPQVYLPQYNNSAKLGGESLNNFDVEDKAIISAQAKILNELDKFNAGEGNEIDLAMAASMGKIQVEAEAKVIKTKNEMMGTILNMME